MFGQDPTTYSGSLSFNYSGLGGNGTFSGDFSVDTTSGAGAIQFADEDTTTLIISAFQPAGDDSVDIFLILLRDTTGDGITDATFPIFNPEDPFPSMILLENIDSVFAADLFSILPDSSDIVNPDSINTDSLLAEILTLLVNNAYVNVSGGITFATSDSDSVAGSFNGLVTPTNIFYAKTITNGQFNLYPAEIPIDLAVQPESQVIPRQFEIQTIAPNPFNPSTTIIFSVNEKTFITLDIVDVTGAHVQRLSNGSYQPGTHSIVWHPQNQSAGLYFALLSSSSGIATRKILFLK